MVLKPATPGFLTTLTATILLAVVSFSVPYFKSVYFLQASYNTNGVSGLINIGTLGYCIVVNGNTTCTKPSIGYQFDPNTLLGTKTQVLGQTIEIPEVVTKWVTYALFLHVIGFGLAGISAIFGLLAHVREFSMSCFSSCVSGGAAAVTLIAFIFDLVLFFVARARIKSLDGAVATIGNALWLTLAAWILLFISGCMFGIGRCCIGRRPRAPKSSKADEPYAGPPATLATPAGNAYAEQMRMDAIKAEIDRKARQNASKHENGLPAFDEYEPETRPLTTQSDEDHTPYRDNTSPGHNRFGAAGAATGYVPSHSLQATPQRQPSATSLSSPPLQHASSYNAAGVGAAAAYGRSSAQTTPERRQNSSSYAPSFPASPAQGGTNTYPPQQPGGFTQRQASLGEGNIYERAGLGATAAAGAVAAAGAASSGRNDYLRPDAASQQRADPYGHHTQGSSYYSAYSHQPYPSQYADHQRENSSYPPAAQQQPYGGQYSAYTAQSSYPPTATDPYAQQQSAQTQYPSAQQAYGQQGYGAMPVTTSPPTVSTTPFSSSTHYDQQQAAYDPYSQQQQYTSQRQPTMPSAGPGDLNFVGVPAPPRSGPASPVSAYSSQQQQHTSPQQVSPTRLYDVREERQPSSLGASATAGGSSRPPLPVPDEAPPEYEPSEGSGVPGGWRNEKATYRPQNGY